VKLAVLCSRVRVEEKVILKALQERDLQYDRLDERKLVLCLQNGQLSHEYDAIWCRAISHTRALYALSVLEAWGSKVVNSHSVVRTCGDKVLTTMALIREGVPTPRTVVALSADAALTAIEGLGYPVVLKPVVGSWGRLLSRVNDRETAEAVVAHKDALGGPLHRIFYIQEYVDKPSRDIRTMVVGDEVVYGMYRRSEHWITNTARGGEALPCQVTDELRDLSLEAARAVGGGILAVDILETPDGGLLVNEVNDTPEFHGAMQAVDVDIPGKMIDYILKQV